MGLANVSDQLLAYFLKQVELPISVTSLLLAVVKAVVYVIGVLIMLNYLGISIAPLITALGVGGLAMALALQDTLSNLFAGMHIMAEQTIRVGDFIRLETGQEGYVEDISWRTTRIRMLPNNMVIVPNNKLSQSVITNYYLPEQKMVLQVPVSVSYASDPDHRRAGICWKRQGRRLPRSPACWPIRRRRSGCFPASASHPLLSAFCAISARSATRIPS